MDKESVELIVGKLEAMADKLGVTAEHLWGVALQQAQVEVVVIGFAFAGFIASVIGVVYSLQSCGRHGWSISKPQSFSPNPPTKSCIGVIVGGIATLILAIASALSFAKFATCCLNPEYFALRSILRGSFY